jgi:hypothetical protein
MLTLQADIADEPRIADLDADITQIIPVHHRTADRRNASRLGPRRAISL